MIANFEGSVNVTTLSCIVTDFQFGNQITTIWSIENFRNVPDLQIISDQFAQSFLELMLDGDLRPSGTSTFHNRLKVLVLSSELDGVIIYWGIGQQPRLANFTLKIYSKSEK